MHMVFSGGGKALPQAAGLAGGYPGGTEHEVIMRDSNIRALFRDGRIPGELAELSGAEQIVQPEDESDIGWDDVFFTHWQAGGGYGDPLRRLPSAVIEDLAAGKISLGAAQDIYGVALQADGTHDERATAALRDRLRHERAGIE